MNSHWLPEHVYVSVSPNGAVFLDVRADRYIGIDQTQTRALIGTVQGWPAGANPAENGRELVALEVVQEVVRNLVNRGLLVPIEQPGKPASPIVLTADNVPLVAVGQDARARARIQARDICRFAMAIIEAYWLLSWKSLASAVERARARKRAVPDGVRRFDPDRAADLIAKFRFLRIFIFTAKNHCLFHSVALLAFLARYQVYPSWVIGVETSPFAAHSWVQCERWVLDATPEQVSFYRPLLSI